MRLVLSFLVLALVALPGRAGPATQGDRRDREAPEFLLETGGRTATCDVLTFTPSGDALLAAGDDKVVRSWTVGDKGLAPGSVLRWSVWREQRGSIYAIALDPTAKRVAVAGTGVRTDLVVVLDRATGHVEASLLNPLGKENIDYGIRALAFSPDGTHVAIGTSTGDVWLWDIHKTSARKLGTHRPEGWEAEFDRVRLLAFLAEDRLLAVAEDGHVLEWDTSEPGKRTEWFAFGLQWRLTRVALSPDRRLLAAAARGPVVVVRSLDGRDEKQLTLGDNEFPRSLAFDRTSKRLAVGIGKALRPGGFFAEAGDRLALYDLAAEKPRETAGPTLSYLAEAIAFHPKEANLLAVAGGSDDDVTLWDLNRPAQPVSNMRGVGTCLWQVGLSQDGAVLGFRDHRAAKPAGPNERGTGPWRTFDLGKRQWDPQKTPFEPVPQLDSVGGWTVESDADDSFLWYAVKDGVRWPLLLSANSQRPLCYVFLRKPARLVVGHYYGASLFDLEDPAYRTDKGLRPARLYTGHDGYVTSIAVSADQKWMVTASLDQTVSAWNLGGWDYQDQLGADFKLSDGRLLVRKVALGSPAWEAGLVPGDEVVLLAAGGRKVFSLASKKYGPAGGSPEAALARLEAPEAGRELYFGLRRAGREDMIETLTTVRQRPLWRFFPTRTNEWALWMWRAPYYQSSINGDFYVGWQLNNPKGLEHEPTFYRAEQFRALFNKPLAIGALLRTRSPEEALGVALANREDALLPPQFNSFEPPAVRIEGLPKHVADKGVEVTLVAEPTEDNPDHQPQRAELWVNGYRVQEWGPLNRRFRATVTLPPEVFRAGTNRVTLQCYNHVEGRGIGRAEVTETIECTRPAGPGRLFGLLVGINDYSQTVTKTGGRGLFRNLECAVRDAEELASAWDAQQRGALYRGVQLTTLPAPGRPATRQAILDALKALAKEVGPDDRVIIFLSGHGDLAGPEKDKEFVFCCPSYDPKQYATTGLTSHDLYEALAAIRCRKVVFLDACHSGDLALNPVRDLTPGGQGPIIVSACDQAESSWEEGKLLKHGLFTYALLEAMSKGFDEADQDPKDGQLNVPELYEYIRNRVAQLTEEIKKPPQTPVCFPPEPERFPLVKKLEVKGDK